MRPASRSIVASALYLAVPGAVGAAADEAWPNRQAIRLIVPYAAGGNGDIAAAKSIAPDIADEFASYGVR